MSTTYPNQIDQYTVKTDQDVVQAAHINNPQDAIEAIETALGTNPSGSYCNVKDAMPSHWPMTRAYLAGNQGVTPGNWRPVHYVKDFQLNCPDNGWDDAEWKFVVPTGHAGLYHVTADVTAIDLGSAEYRVKILFYDGASWSRKKLVMETYSGTDGRLNIIVDDYIQMTAGQAIQISFYNGFTSNVRLMGHADKSYGSVNVERVR